MARAQQRSTNHHEDGNDAQTNIDDTSKQVMGPDPPTTSIKPFKGVRLNDTNYTMRAYQMRVHLRSLNLWKIVETETTSDPHKKDIYLSEIVSNVDESQIMTSSM